MIATVGHLREVLAEFPDYYGLWIEGSDEDTVSSVLDVRKQGDMVILSSDLGPSLDEGEEYASHDSNAG